MIRSLLLCACVSLGLTGIASGQSRPETERAVLDFGLIGVWAAECDKPPSTTNNQATYARSSSGEITLTYRYGPGYQPTSYAIVSAKRPADDRLMLREEIAGSQRTLDILLIKANNRIRVWSSTDDQGAVLVKDGTITDNRDTRWLERCR